MSTKSDKAFIQFTTHAVIITREDDLIKCFKFAQGYTFGHREVNLCDFDIFKTESEATEWILIPFPLDHYQLELS